MKPKRNGSRIPIDYDLVSKVALLNPSNDELAWALDISRATLYRRLQDDEQLREILEAGRHGRRLSLKRAQDNTVSQLQLSLLVLALNVLSLWAPLILSDKNQMFSA